MPQIAQSRQERRHARVVVQVDNLSTAGRSSRVNGTKYCGCRDFSIFFQLQQLLLLEHAD